MTPDGDLSLRPTREQDLDFVLALEHDAEQRGLIGTWTREQPAALLVAPEREHWIIERASPEGYLIAYDFTARRLGVYVKRIAVADKGAGVGRRALYAFARHA